MDNVAPHVIYEFEGFEFDARRGVLRRKTDGQALTLTPKVISALVYLVERAGTLVEKQALYGALWPNVVVEESNLTQTIHVLRRALGEHPEDHRFIVTVPGRGYRFVADVAMRTVQGPAQLGSPVARRRRVEGTGRRLKWALGCAVPLALVAATITVYQVRAPPTPEVGASGSHLWSAAYERELDDVFVVQREIAAAVAEALETRLASPTGRRNGTASDAAAHENFLRGQFFYHRREPGDLERALHYYERSVALDPSYARAWAGVAAIACIQTELGSMPRATGLPRLLEAATKTVALDPGMAQGHVRLGCYYKLIGNNHLAKVHFGVASNLEPSDPLVLGIQAGMAAEQGRFDEAIALQRRVVGADPLSAVYNKNLGAFLFAAGRLEEARVQLLRAYELSPDFDVAGTLVQVLVLQRRFDAALAFVEHLPQSPAREEGLALVYHAQGRTLDANAALASLIASSATADPFRLAEVHAYRGDADKAFEWLELAARPTDPVNGVLPGFRELWEMRASPILAPLHADPRWASWGLGPA